MTTVTIVEVEETSRGDIAELILHARVAPALGMILMDEDSLTWEITGILHDPSRTTDEGHGKRFTLICQGVSTELPIHKGEYKLIH